MKKLFIAFAALIVFSSTINASSTNVNSNVNSTLQQTQTVLYIGDITGLSTEEIDAKITHSLSSINATDLTCSVSVMGELDLGFITFEITVTVSGPCEEVKKSGRKIALDLLKQVKDYIAEVF